MNLISMENFALVAQYADLFKQGMIVTILLSALTVLFGFLLALLLAIMRLSTFQPLRFLALDKQGHLRDQGALVVLSRFNPISFIATVYVELIRATPMLVQLWLVYFLLFNKNVISLPQVTVLGFIRLERFIPGVVALALNSGAYLSEIIRAGIQSIDGGQTEAAAPWVSPRGRTCALSCCPRPSRTFFRPLPTNLSLSSRNPPSHTPSACRTSWRPSMPLRAPCTL